MTSTPPEHRHPDVIKYNDVKPTDREIGLCYAVSKDGIHWEKPELGLAEFEGATSNNIVTRRRGVAGIYKDDRDPDTARRYKMFFSASRGTFVAFSPDGLHWGEAYSRTGARGRQPPQRVLVAASRQIRGDHPPQLGSRQAPSHANRVVRLCDLEAGAEHSWRGRRRNCKPTT